MKDATIALIAHDGKKDDLVSFVEQHSEWFGNFKLVGTGTTGGRIAKRELQLNVLLVVRWVETLRLLPALQKAECTQ